MEDIIKKAISGGVWEDEYFTSDYNLSQIPQIIVCDPLFWHSLSKACGWETQFDEDKGFNHQWLNIAKHFHEINLTQGWNQAVEYLQSIIK